ncbi:MAG: DUF4363 family protein [Firmicutes bacterium]|nr:DUF4363 family protein [Bacillota bacterium]
MKILVIPIIFLGLIIGLGVFEHFYLKAKFFEFEEKISEIYIDTKNEMSKPEEVEELELWWDDQKKTLHVFVPHTLLKEIDFYLAESKGLISAEKFEFALSKLEVLKTLVIDIPGSFTINFGNIF